MKKLISIIAILAVFTGCNLSTYTVKIPVAKLQKSVETKFPIKRKMTIGTLSLTQPKVMLNEKTKKVMTKMAFSYKMPFFKTQTGSINVAGIPKYVASKSAFYLNNPSIEELKFNNSSIGNAVSNSTKGMLSSIVNEVFKNYPIYKLKDGSMKNKLLKNTIKSIGVKNDVLELNLGI